MKLQTLQKSFKCRVLQFRELSTTSKNKNCTQYTIVCVRNRALNSSTKLLLILLVHTFLSLVSEMAVIHHSIDLDVNSNCYKDPKDGYWGQSQSSLFGLDAESSELAGTIRAVALRLEGTLRMAKKAHLSCGEVLLPPDLLSRVARDIIRMADTEPCGLRGCMILLNFESGSSLNNSSSSIPNNPSGTPNFNSHSNSQYPSNNSGYSDSTTNSNPPSPSASANRRKIGRIEIDSQTVTTFELNVTLKEDLAPWYSRIRLPQILRNLTKGGTIVVSPAYTVAKKKLYR